MKHIINGQQIDLRHQPLDRLELLASLTQDRIDRANEELDSLMGEIIRRKRRYIIAVPSA
jgi:hypothetical protein